MIWKELIAIKIILALMLIVLTLAPGAFGVLFLKETIEDIATLGEAEKSVFLQPTKLIGAERHSIDYSYEYQDTISASNLVLHNTHSQINLVLPLKEQLIGEKDVLGIFVYGNNSQFQADYNAGGFDSSGQSDIVRFLYGVRLTDYLDAGVGVSQYRNPELNLDRGLGYSYEIRLSPSKSFEIGYGSERLRTANLTRIDYDGSWSEYPAHGISSRQRMDISAWFGNRLNLELKHQQEQIDPYSTDLLNESHIYGLNKTTEIKTTYNLNEDFKFKGLLGWKDIGQDIKYYEEDRKFAFIQGGSLNHFGSVGMAWRLQDIDLSFDLSNSSIDLNSRGAYFSENLPDIISNVDNLDKTADAQATISTSGCHFGLSGPLSERLAYKGKFSYLSMIFEGDANVWNGLFFGIVRQLEESYVAPVTKADLLEGELGLKYLIHDELEANYTFKQIIPLSVEEVFEGSGSADGDFAEGSASSGGSTHLVSLTYYF